MRSEQEKRIDLSEKFDFGQKKKKKEGVWCLAEAGPFRKFLVLIRLDKDSCGLWGGPVKSTHLLFECDRIPSDCRLLGEYSTESFELAFTRLVKFLKAIWIGRMNLQPSGKSGKSGRSGKSGKDLSEATSYRSIILISGWL